MQKFPTLGQRLLAEKYVGQKIKEEKKNNPKNGDKVHAAMPKGNAHTSLGQINVCFMGVF